MDYSAFGYLVVGAYAVIAVLLGHQLMNKSSRRLNPTLYAAPVLFIHLIWLFSGLFDGAGLNLSLAKLVSLTSLLITTSLTIGHRRFSAILLLPPVYLFNAVALLPDLLTHHQYLTYFSNNPGLALHVTLALIAYSLFIMAALMAIQVWVIDYRLKHHGSLHNLPPLVVVDKQLSLLLRTGFVVLTISIASGWYFLDHFFAEGQRHKAVFTLLAWGLYGWMIWQDYRSGLSSKRIAILSVMTGIILTLAYFGSRFVREVILG